MLRIEFICLVVNRRSLDRVYPGGSTEFIKAWGPFNGRSSAYDDDLIKFGAMDPTVIDDFIRRLEDLGLVGLSQESGIKEWKDFCVVEELMGLRARCGWISYDDSERSASFVDSA